jgi:osmoprotectant transport system permease protein
VRLSPPPVLFALIGGAGLSLSFVQFKANRIVLGEGMGLADLPHGSWLMLALGGVLLAACLPLWPLVVRVTVAAGGLVALILSLGLAASHLTPQGNSLARVSPAAGFWLLALAFGLMLADAVNRLRPSLLLRWLLLGAALVLAGAILASGLLDGISVMREYATRRELFLREAQAHLMLAFGPLGLALLMGIPAGIAVFQVPRWRGPVLGVLNILQTIPSLALFGIMIPIFGWVAATLPGAARLGVSGIGTFPALVALFLYSLLPVVSNTLAGLSGVPAATREAAVGLGMTRVQVLSQVLVPLALPVLLAAVRIVLVQNIGLAVIAGLIGGGGFGTFVFQGLNQTAMDLVLLGALPTIALALVAGIALDLLVRAARRDPA